MVQHYLVGAPDRDGSIRGICGTRVRFNDVPPVTAPRCEACTVGVRQVKVAMDYADERGITPEQAGYALNLSPFVLMDLRA